MGRSKTVITKVELKIPSDFKDKAFFYYLIKNFKVVPNIVEASFSTTTGWAVVNFEGKQDELDKLFNFLEGKGVEVTPC